MIEFLLIYANKILYRLKSQRKIRNNLPEDPASSTGGRLIFKCIYLCVLGSNNLVSDPIYYGIKLKF